MSALSSQDVAHLGRLARLNITEEESGRFAEQLSSVVEYVEQLESVDANVNSQTLGVTGMVNVLAADQLRTVPDLATVPAQDLINGAPVHDGRFFVVRAVLGNENGGA